MGIDRQQAWRSSPVFAPEARSCTANSLAITATNGWTTRRLLPRPQLVDEVADHLRAAIISGGLSAGTAILQDQTAAGLGVSSGRVREALLTLRAEGLVAQATNRLHVVLPVEIHDIEDIFWLQANIAERLAVTAAQLITEAEIDALDWINGALSEAVSAEDMETIAAADFDFHRTFISCAGRNKLSWFLFHVAGYIPPVLYAADPEWGDAAVECNHRLIAALRRRDIEGVVAETAQWFTQIQRAFESARDGFESKLQTKAS
ncbi:MAG TPA: GntR family transcriptional regulator [Mycobacterium sp.]|nr:GntR family transcriptional regulator [Mycobacterium sp.]